MLTCVVGKGLVLSSCRRPYVYRRIVAGRIGRALQPHEVVHHIDGDCCNNDPRNLLALSGQAAHVRIHMFMLREEQGLTHLFPLEEILEACLDSIVWVSEAGAVEVFGEDAGALIAAEIRERYRHVPLSAPVRQWRHRHPVGLPPYPPPRHASERVT